MRTLPLRTSLRSRSLLRRLPRAVTSRANAVLRLLNITAQRKMRMAIDAGGASSPAAMPLTALRSALCCRIMPARGSYNA